MLVPPGEKICFLQIEACVENNKIYSSHCLMFSFPSSSINSLISLYSFSTIISPCFYIWPTLLTPFLQQQKTTPLHWLRQAISPSVKSRLSTLCGCDAKSPNAPGSSVRFRLLTSRVKGITKCILNESVNKRVLLWNYKYPRSTAYHYYVGIILTKVVA